MSNLLSELFSGIILLIALFYSEQMTAKMTKSWNSYNGFIICGIACVLLNFASYFAIYSGFIASPLFSYTAITAYYAAIPLAPLFLLAYFYLTSPPHHRSGRKMIYGLLIAYAVYLASLIANLFAHFIFSLSADNNLIVEKYNLLPQTVFILFSAASVVYFILFTLKCKQSALKLGYSFIAALIALILIFTKISTYLFTEFIIAASALCFLLYFQNHQITYDDMTQTFNRGELLKELERRLAQPDGEQRFSIITVSLRGFKQVNQRFGQTRCDNLLSEIAAFLKSLKRDLKVYRYSGDEFSLILDSGAHDYEGSGIDEICGAVIDRFEKPWTVGDYQGYVLSVGVGVVMYPENVKNNIQEIISGVEACVVAAKKNLVSNICFCSEEMLETERRKIDIINILKQVTETGDFDIYYQPILDLSSRRYKTAEALLRINTPPAQQFSIGEIISVAEESGIIIELTPLIFRRVCHFIQTLIENGVNFDGIAVNLSGAQCMEADLSSKIIGIINEFNIPPSYLKIEITETTFVENMQTLRSMVDLLGKNGISFEMDDFGMGYSNFQTLLNFPFSVIKIDRSLIVDAPNSSRTAGIVRHIIWAMQEIGITAIAEGVETPEENLFAIESGFDMIQGFLYCRPLSEEDAQNFFTGQTRREANAKSKERSVFE